MNTTTLEEFLRTQIANDDQRQSIMEKAAFLIDRLSLCTKTDCDYDTLENRLRKLQVSHEQHDVHLIDRQIFYFLFFKDYQNELKQLNDDFQSCCEQYQSTMEAHLNGTIKLIYEKSFEQIRHAIDNSQQTIERAMNALTHVRQIWQQYEKTNETILVWLDRTELELTAYHNDDDQQALNYYRRTCQTIADKNQKLKQLEELELSIVDYDWSKYGNNTATLRQR
jgi:flagellar biosynthesis chaperone FliJ